MIDWLLVALVGGLVGLDATSFPQMMISRPLLAGAITGALFGRPVEGILIGFVMEAFSLIILPIGAVRYPESGTATVAAVAAYAAAAPAGLDTGYFTLAVGFALGWEQVAGDTVVVLRQANGRLLARRGAVAPRQLEQRHIAAMTMDFVRGAAVSLAGAVVALAALRLVGPFWGLEAVVTVPILALIVAAMLGTGVALFGGWGARRLAIAAGAVVGVVVAVVLA